MMISAILLGAGKSERMGVDKLSLSLGRETILEHCFKTLFLELHSVESAVEPVRFHEFFVRSLFHSLAFVDDDNFIAEPYC